MKENRDTHGLAPANQQDKKQVLLQTTSLHLATLLYALGGTERRMIKTNHTTPQGTPKMAWQFEHTQDSEQVVALWQNANRHDGKEEKCKDWDQMSLEERKQAMRIVAAFANNLKHFLGMVNGNVRVV